MAAKPWLNDYFKRLAENLERDEIINERALSATVELPLSGWVKGKSLLQALEYDKDNVHNQYPIRVGTSKPRVDFLLGKNTTRWMLDLKKPGDQCDRPKHVEQMQSYLSQEKVVLGVLFNGTKAQAYINPDHPFVAEICQTIKEKELKIIPKLDLKKYPVKEATLNSGDVRELVEFFRLLRCNNGSLPDIQAISKRLTEEYTRNLRKEASKEARVLELKRILLETITNPDEQILQAIINTSSKFSTLKAKPSELLEIWPQLENFYTDSSHNKKQNRGIKKT